MVMTAGLFRFTSAALFRTIAITAVALDLTLLMLEPSIMPEPTGPFRFTPLATATRILMAAATLFTFPLTGSWQMPAYRPEFFTFMLSVLLGCQLMAVGDQAAVLLIGLELSSIGSYALAGYLFSRTSAEAGMKYFLFGGTATAVLVFGLSLITASGTGLSIHAIASRLATGSADSLFMTGLVMVSGALLFKLSAAPVQLWAPDVYQASPLSAIGIFSTVPKIAAAAVLAALAGSRPSSDAVLLIAAVAILTLIAGNFPALLQQDVRRLMAYSGIGQSAFLLLAILIIPSDGYQYLFFYAMVMSLATLLVLYCLQWFERRYDTKQINDFAGLGRDNRIASVGLTAGFLSLTGLPPFAGFTAKLLIFNGLWSIGGFDANPLLLTVFVFGLFNTVVSLFFYLKIPYYLFLKTGTRKSHGKVTGWQVVLILLMTTLLTVLFLAPGTVI